MSEIMENYPTDLHETDMEVDSKDENCLNSENEEKYSDVRTIHPPETLNDLIKELHKVFSQDKVNVEYVQTLMTLYKSKPKEWKKFAKFDTHRYTRNLVDSGNGKFNLMILCWNEAQGSSIHSHANAHCFMKVMDGDVQEELFDWPSESEGEQEMKSVRVNKYSKNQVAYINDDLGLHRVENPSHTDKAVSLHLYSPPFDSCQCFDQRTGHKSTAKVTFWSKYGKRTPFGREGASCQNSSQMEAENN